MTPWAVGGVVVLAAGAGLLSLLKPRPPPPTAEDAAAASPDGGWRARAAVANSSAAAVLSPGALPPPPPGVPPPSHRARFEAYAAATAAHQAAWDEWAAAAEAAAPPPAEVAAVTGDWKTALAHKLASMDIEDGAIDALLSHEAMSAAVVGLLDFTRLEPRRVAAVIVAAAEMLAADAFYRTRGKPLDFSVPRAFQHNANKLVEAIRCLHIRLRKRYGESVAAALFEPSGHILRMQADFVQNLLGDTETAVQAAATETYASLHERLTTLAATTLAGTASPTRRGARPEFVVGKRRRRPAAGRSGGGSGGGTPVSGHRRA